MVRFLNTSMANTDVEDLMNSVNDYILLNRKDKVSLSSTNYNVEEAIIRLGNNLMIANESYRIRTDKEIISSRKYMGRLFSCVKKVIRKLIKWHIDDIVNQQIEYNANVTRYLNEGSLIIQYLYEQNQNLYNLLSDHEKEIRKLNADISKLISPTDIDKKIENDQFYLDFENTFRGSEEDIKLRNKFYLPYFEGKRDVIDIGCGRGEFLELMRDNQISAIGVDINSKMIETCINKGLNVIFEDGITYLKNREDGSIDGIFACQVVEHMSIEQLDEFIDISYRKLKVGGHLILETVNPLTLGVYCYSFYMDPTHYKPVHPATLRFILERKGYEVKPIQFLDYFTDRYKFIVSEEMNEVEKENVNKLNDVIYGAQDYAIICERK